MEEESRLGKLNWKSRVSSLESRRSNESGKIYSSGSEETTANKD